MNKLNKKTNKEFSHKEFDPTISPHEIPATIPMKSHAGMRLK